MIDTAPVSKLSWREQINFLLTNRIPRRWSTLFMGWFSQIESRLLCQASLYMWRLFARDMNLTEAKKDRFSSLHDVFIRELKDGARTVSKEPDVIISPCDAIVGAFGSIDNTMLFQAKGFPYELSDLLPNKALVDKYRNGIFTTLRLKSSMYHRFHAPCECRIREVLYISGDTWNVNPVALKRVEQLFCKNERVVLDLNLRESGTHLALVPVAAILVAGIKLHCLENTLDLKYKGPNRLTCNASYHRGDELGYFQHGSTILVFAAGNIKHHESLKPGVMIRMGQPLLKKFEIQPADQAD